MRRKRFYRENRCLIVVSIVFIMFAVIGSCINKVYDKNIDTISSQIGELVNYYSKDIDVMSVVILNIKEYIRYLGFIGILSLLFFTFPLAILMFITKAISIGYTINTCVLLLGFDSIKMCIIVLLKNIVVIPASIILVILAYEYIKNIFKQLKKRNQEGILSLGKRFLLSLAIVMLASIVLQSILNIISISILQFLA